MEALIIPAVFALGAFTLYLGHVGMTYRLGIHYANIIAIVGFFFPPAWLVLVPFAFPGWSLWRQERRARRNHAHVNHHAAPQSSQQEISR